MKLEDIVAEMFESNEKCGRVLSRGLALGFTPQAGDGVQDGARFVWSRRGDHPSEIEDGILQKAIVRGMKSVTRFVVTGGPTFRTGLVLLPGWGSSMLYWSWVGSGELLTLNGRKRERALEWIDG